MKKITLAEFVAYKGSYAKAAEALGVIHQMIRMTVDRTTPVYVYVDDCGDVLNAKLEKGWGKFK